MFPIAPSVAIVTLYTLLIASILKKIVNNIGAKHATAPNYYATMCKMIGMFEKEVKRLGL